MGNSTSGPLYRFASFEADARSGELRNNGEKVRIQEQPFQVLIALLERPGEVVSREEFRQRLWPSDTFVDFDHGLNATINKLRDALGDSAASPRFIETLPKRGYRFLAAVERPTVEAAEPRSEKIPASETSLVGEAIVQPAQKTSAPELPDIDHKLARLLFALLQVMYVIFYVVALWRLDEADWRMQRYMGVPAATVMVIVLVTASIGLALRLYTLTASAFRYRLLGKNFRKVFPLFLIIDVIWAMSPFFLLHLIGIGLAFAASAALVYSPFAQRVLATVGYPAGE